jgi:ssDNA-binding Zn-finger/Zn-ribbon topoisomerase 1
MGSEVQVVTREEQGLVSREQAGMLAMATMSEPEFEIRLVALKRGQDRIKRIKQELMEEDAHYGVIPGTKKPTLLKPGAEVLCSIYGLRPDFIPTLQEGDGVTAPTLRVTMRCELHLGDIAGPVVAVGYGSANSWERKHRYRRGERACPACGVVGQIIKGKDEYGGGWLCWSKKGGCGAKWPDGAPEIEGQQCGDVANPDPYDLENTLVKMAKKRAHIDAALTGTASSDLFTQDLEEQGPSQKDHAPAAAPPPQRAPAAPTGDAAPCPQCGRVVAPSKYAKPGASHYCAKCKHGFVPPPADEPWKADEPWNPDSEGAERE